MQIIKFTLNSEIFFRLICHCLGQSLLIITSICIKLEKVICSSYLVLYLPRMRIFPLLSKFLFIFILLFFQRIRYFFYPLFKFSFKLLELLLEGVQVSQNTISILRQLVVLVFLSSLIPFNSTNITHIHRIEFRHILLHFLDLDIYT
jgi:hypothetical protein